MTCWSAGSDRRPRNAQPAYPLRRRAPINKYTMIIIDPQRWAALRPSEDEVETITWVAPAVSVAGVAEAGAGEFECTPLRRPWRTC